jgi:DNA-binding CsgD family transcriptional regulator
VSDELLALERELAGVVELADLCGPILNRLQRLMGASGSTIAAYQHRRPGVPSMRGGTIGHIMSQYPTECFHGDPLYRWNLKTSPNLFIVTGARSDAPGGGAELFEALAKCGAYHEFYRPHQIGRMCGVRPTGLRYGSPHMFGLMFVTPTLSRDFDPKGIRKMRQLEVPLRSAAARIARFREAQCKENVLYQLLERQRGSFVVWDADGRLTWVSAEADALLGGVLARCDLEQAAALALRQLRRADTASRDQLLGRPRQLRSAQGCPLVVEFSWITASDLRPWLLAEIKHGGGASALLVQLSPAEARVLRLIARGLSNSEIARGLSSSAQTVKTHVKHVFAKLGVHSRAKATRMAIEAWERGNASVYPPEAAE